VFDVRTGGSGAGDGDDQFSEAGYLVGRDSIMEFMRTVGERMLSVHQGHMPEIEITSHDTATAFWALEDLVKWPEGEGPVNTLHGFGHYHDTYERIRGQWYVKTSRLTRLRVDVT